MTNTNINSVGARLVGVDDPTRDDHAATKGYVDAHGGGGSVSVTDGSTTVTGTTELDFTSGATVTDAGGGVAQVAVAGGGSQAFLRTTLRHSADFANLVGGIPVTVFSPPIEDALTLPPSLFGNDSIIDVLVYNPTANDAVVTATLVVQSGDGTVWIQQDSPSDQTIPAGGSATLDLSTNSGSAGSGLSWNSGTKQVDIASAGVWSAFLTIEAGPA